MDWIDTSGLFCEVFDNVCFKEPSSKERDLQDKLWMLEVVNNGIWTERECSLVWNHMRDLKNGGARSASSIWDHTTGTISDQITRHEVQLRSTLLQPFWNHRIQSVPNYDWSSSRFDEKWKQKGFYTHFVIETKLMRCRAKMLRFRTKMMRFRTWMTQFRTDVT